jgi:hypothetical protein
MGVLKSVPRLGSLLYGLWDDTLVAQLRTLNPLQKVSNQRLPFSCRISIIST